MKRLILLFAITLASLSTAQAAVVAHLDFDDLSGTGVDGNALDTEIDDSLSTSIFPPSGSDPRTFSVWINPSNLGNTGTGQRKFISYGATTAGEAFTLSVEAGALYVRHYGGNFFFNVGIEIDTWYHVAARVNDDATTFADVDIFLNGTLLSVDGINGAGTSQTIDTADTNLHVGEGFDGLNFIGLIDELTVYDVALTNSEISFLSENAGAVIPEPAAATLFLGSLGLLAFHRRRRTS